MRIQAFFNDIAQDLWMIFQRPLSSKLCKLKFISRRQKSNSSRDWLVYSRSPITTACFWTEPFWGSFLSGSDWCKLFFFFRLKWIWPRLQLNLVTLKYLKNKDDISRYPVILRTEIGFTMYADWRHWSFHMLELPELPYLANPLIIKMYSESKNKCWFYWPDRYSR